MIAQEFTNSTAAAMEANPCGIGRDPECVGDFTHAVALEVDASDEHALTVAQDTVQSGTATHAERLGGLELARFVVERGVATSVS